VQSQGQVHDLPSGPRGCIARAGAALAQLGRHHLLDQVGLPVRGGLDRPQVPGLDAELAERCDRTGHRESLRAVLPAHPPDQAVVFELGQLRLADPRRLKQLAAGQVRGGLASGAVLAIAARAAAAAMCIPGEPLLDHPQRQVGVPLHGQDVPQPLDVRRGEPAVTRARPGRLDQPLGLEEADLGRADVRKFRAQLGEHLADTELTARGLLAHA